MIIAWGLFVTGILWSIMGLFNLKLFCKERATFKVKYDFIPSYNTVWFSALLAICSAQYIWG